MYIFKIIYRIQNETASSFSANSIVIWIDFIK